MSENELTEAAVAEARNRNAQGWARDVRAGLDWFRESCTLPAFIAFLPDLSGLDVIDRGCGEGFNTHRFVELRAPHDGHRPV